MANSRFTVNTGSQPSSTYKNVGGLLVTLKSFGSHAQLWPYAALVFENLLVTFLGSQKRNMETSVRMFFEIDLIENCKLACTRSDMFE